VCELRRITEIQAHFFYHSPISQHYRSVLIFLFPQSYTQCTKKYTAIQSNNRIRVHKKALMVTVLYKKNLKHLHAFITKLIWHKFNYTVFLMKLLILKVLYSYYIDMEMENPKKLAIYAHISNCKCN
jgi:hypothetical protein